MGRAGERRRFLTVLLAVLAVGWAAHGFLFANEFYSHDSVSFFSYASWGFPDGDWRFYFSAGRFLIPVLELMKGGCASPWLTGLLFVFWMTLAAWETAGLFGIQTLPGLAGVSAVFCANHAMTLTGATYLYCLDEYAFALFLAVWSARQFQRGGWRRNGLGILMLAASLGVYQAYFTTAASLCLLSVMKKLTEGERPALAVRRGFRYLGLLAAGFVSYYAFWTLLCGLLDIAKRRTEEAGVLGALPGSLWTANWRYLQFLFPERTSLDWLLRGVNGILLCLLLYRLFSLLRDKALPLGNRVLLTGLACLLPTAFFSAFVLVPGGAHYLMTFPGELVYLLPILAAEPEARRRFGRTLRRLTAVLLCLIVWQHIVFANQAYMKKELEKNSTLVLASQVIGRIEGLEGYEPGVTPVAFAGRLDENRYLDQESETFRDISGWTGLFHQRSATYNLGRYLTDYLNCPLNWDQETDYSAMEEVRAMPEFPASGSVAMIGGTAVVKLSG